MAEELHDSQDLAPQADGKSERPAQAFVGRDGCPGEIRVPADVREPSGLAASPNPAGQAHAWRKGHLPTDSFKVRYPEARSVPDFHTVKGLSQPVHAPEGSDVPIEVLADG